MIKLLVTRINKKELYRKFREKADTKDEINTEIKSITETSGKGINYKPIVELLYSMMIFDNENN